MIKIEDPKTGGDTLRRLSPLHNDAPVWWKVSGRNKRSVAINLRGEKGATSCSAWPSTPMC